MEKLKNHFSKWAPKKFVLAAVAILIVTDLLNSWYLKLFWLKKDLSTMLVLQMIQKNGYTVESFSTETIQQMKGFIDNSFYFFIFLVLINNLFFYCFYLRRKLWAQSYVVFYTLTAALFAVTFLVDHAGLGPIWYIYNLMTLPLYLYLYFGVKLLKDQTVDINPVSGKKGR